VQTPEGIFRLVCHRLYGRTTNPRHPQRVSCTWRAPAVTSWWRHSVATPWLVSQATGSHRRPRLQLRVRDCDWLCSFLVLPLHLTTVFASTLLKTLPVPFRLVSCISI